MHKQLYDLKDGSQLFVSLSFHCSLPPLRIKYFECPEKARHYGRAVNRCKVDGCKVLHAEVFDVADSYLVRLFDEYEEYLEGAVEDNESAICC